MTCNTNAFTYVTSKNKYLKTCYVTEKLELGEKKNLPQSKLQDFRKSSMNYS